MELKRFLKQDMEGEDVFFLQNVLKEVGLFRGKVTGYYGKDTSMAIANIQRVNNIKVTGEIDIRTWKFIVNQYDLINSKTPKEDYFYKNQNGLIISKSEKKDIEYHSQKTDKKHIILGEYRNKKTFKSYYPHFIIEKENNNKAIQLLDDNFWSDYVNTYDLSEISINIDLECKGPVFKEKSGKYFNINFEEINPINIVPFENGFKGYYFWGKYTSYQLETLHKLLEYLDKKWDIKISETPIDESWFNIKTKDEISPIINRYNICLDRGLSPQESLLEILNRF